MLPGSASHILKHLSDITSFSELIENTLKFNKSGNVDKAFCISRMTNKSGDSIEEVIILHNPSICAFKRDGKYYLTENGHKEIEISPFKHAILFRIAVRLGRKDEDILRNPIPGVSGENQVLSLMTNSDLFYQNQSSSQAALKKWLPLINQLQDTSAKVGYDQAKTFFEDSEIPQADKDHFLCSLSINHPELALELVEKLKNCSLDSKTWTGQNLTSCAILKGNPAIVEKLVEKGANFFEKNVLGLSALDYALNSGLWEITDMILKQPHTKPLQPTRALILALQKFIKLSNVEKDSLGAKAVMDKLFLELDIDFPFSPFQIGEIEDKTNLLGAFILLELGEEPVSLLLASGADANQGDCLLLAINAGNTKIIEELLSKGADPLKKNSTGLVPLIEAAAKRSPKVLELMIAAVTKKQLNSDNNSDNNNEIVTQDKEGNSVASFISQVADKNKITPLIAAMISRDRNKIQLLLNKGVGLPTSGSVEKFNDVLETLIDTEDLNNLQLLKNFLIDDRVFNHLTSFNKKFLLKNGLFDSNLNQINPASSTFAQLIFLLIEMKDIDSLNLLKTKLKSLKFDSLSIDDKRFIINEKLIDPEVLGDPDSFKDNTAETETSDYDTGESDSDSDSELVGKTDSDSDSNSESVEDSSS